KQYIIYKEWFENYVRNNGQVQFFNATEGGAHITGFKHLTLKNFINIKKTSVELIRNEFRKIVKLNLQGKF
ncbi:hypothetical protein R0K17_25235, partial [Planococcus sp. SIMBA_143]